MVILPDHLLSIGSLPADDCDFSTRWALIKANFSRQLQPTERVSRSRSNKDERGIWQRRFWEHWIRDENDYRRHVDYIHYNPVKQGYVDKPVDWPYSSIHRFIRQGISPPDWAANVDDDLGGFGEQSRLRVRHEPQQGGSGHCGDVGVPGAMTARIVGLVVIRSLGDVGVRPSPQLTR